MKTINLLVHLRGLWRQWRQTEPPNSPEYRIWRQRFLRNRLQFSLQIAVFAYLTFILLRLILASLGVQDWEGSWFAMALAVEICLLLCLGLTFHKVGRRYPEWLFLGCSWSITLTEQVWATLRGEAFIGLFSWTLVFLTQATLMPVLWRFHLISQVGVLVYYLGARFVIGLEDNSSEFWNPTLWLYVFWFCCICDLSVYLYERLQRSEFHARKALEAEQRQSERLLLNILPEAVARQLKKQHRTIAEHFPEVTVLFADIVGFTQMSANIPPDEMVDLLNTIFSAFDHLAERHGLEKIKTIGDAYMVVGGLPLEQANHVAAIADMSLEMQAAIADFNRDRQQNFSIRVGIHTGPVVAGVIGLKKFIYDLWGDTVNIASRMESHGLPGQIQVTEAVYTLLKEEYDFESRGLVAIKGKGDMITYLLRGKRSPQSPR